MIRANSRLIKVLINVILVLLLSLIPLTWYKNEALIVIPERHIPLNPLGDFQRSLFLWDWSCGGRYSRQLFLKLPYLTLLALGRILQISLSLLLMARKMACIWHEQSRLLFENIIN